MKRESGVSTTKGSLQKRNLATSPQDAMPCASCHSLMVMSIAAAIGDGSLFHHAIHFFFFHYDY